MYIYVTETILQSPSAYHTLFISDSTKIHIVFCICKFLRNFFAEKSHKYFWCFFLRFVCRIKYYMYLCIVSERQTNSLKNIQI